MANMTSRERVLAVLNGQTPDRLPWAPLIDGYFTSSLPEQGLQMNEIEAIKYVGGDIILRHVGIIESKSHKVEYREEKSGDETKQIFETPVGSIYTIHKNSGKTSYKTKSFIEDAEDIKVMQYLVEDKTFSLNMDYYNDIEKQIGDAGIPTPSGPLTPIQSLLQHDCGVENFTYLLFDYEDEMRELMDAMHECHLVQYKLMASAPDNVKAVFAYEDTSTTVMGPSWYNEFCKEQIDEYAKIVHDGGKLFITHMCGKLSGLTSEISSGIQDGIDSVCPPTTGDLWAHDALVKIPDKTIIGGIEPPALKSMSVEETIEYTTNVIEQCKATGLMENRLILSTGDATPYGTSVEVLKAVSKVAAKYTY